MSNTKIHLLIVEDNPVIAEDLAETMRDFGYLVHPPVDNAESALKTLKNEKVDLLLLDVGLEGEIDGIQLANIIREKYDLPFIFLTAFHDDKTIERIKSTQPNAYLVKPIDQRSLKTSIEVALYNFNHRSTSVPEPSENDFNFAENEHFFIKVKQGLLKIQFNEVLFFEAYDNYSYVYTNDNKHILGLSLKAVESKLSPIKFIRSHRSYIVNLEKIESIEDDYLIFGSHRIPIGKTYRSDIMSKIKLL